jgi:hypothetical protein
MNWRHVVTGIVFLFSMDFAAGALPPSLLLGGYLDGGASSTLPSSGATFAAARLQGSLGWRQGLGPGSYLAVASRGSIAPYLATIQGFVDSEFLNLELGLPSAADSLIFDAGVDSSLANQTGVGSYAQPAWGAEYRFARGDGGLQPSLSFQGSYLCEQLGSDDHLSGLLLLKLDHSTSVRLGAYAGLSGGWELWTKEQAYDSGGTPTGSLRQDWLLNLSGGVRGFSLSSLDWTIDVSGGARISDASTTATGYSPLALPGGSRLNARVKGNVNWTPSRQVSLSLTGGLENDWYFVRTGVNADGSSAASNFDVMAIEGGIKMDWTPDNTLYLVLQAGAARTFANDPAQGSWSGSLSVGVEYGF